MACAWHVHGVCICVHELHLDYRHHPPRGRRAHRRRANTGLANRRLDDPLPSELLVRVRGRVRAIRVRAGA